MSGLGLEDGLRLKMIGRFGENSGFTENQGSQLGLDISVFSRYSMYSLQ